MTTPWPKTRLPHGRLLLATRRQTTRQAGVQDGGDGGSRFGHQEDAFFNYAKLAFELSFNPFDDAIVAFETYLSQFPTSPRRDEAFRFLLQVHMTSRDYERALQALDNIVDPDETVLASAQVLSFNRAVELYQNKQPQRSLDFFKFALLQRGSPIEC